MEEKITQYKKFSDEDLQDLSSTEINNLLENKQLCIQDLNKLGKLNKLVISFKSDKLCESSELDKSGKFGKNVTCKISPFGDLFENIFYLYQIKYL